LAARASASFLSSSRPTFSAAARASSSSAACAAARASASASITAAAPAAFAAVAFAAAASCAAILSAAAFAQAALFAASSSDAGDTARAAYQQAHQLAQGAGLEYLAIDALHMLLGSERVFGSTPERSLSAVLRASRERQEQVTEQLAAQVEQAQAWIRQL
jgi:hypothetical protein